jgi:anti-sigma factor RsiW
MDDRSRELDLMAYADGQLPPDAADAVRRQVEADPDARAKVRAQGKLCEAARRCLGEPAVPMGLMARVDEMARQQRRWSIGWMSAVAAVLVVGLGAVMMWPTLTGGERREVVRQSDVLPVNWVRSTSRVHLGCSKHLDHFNPAFPKAVEAMPASLKEYLGRDATCPDLSKLGYRFAGCGPCSIPGGKTAHLLYRPTDGSGRCVSLFVQQDGGQLKLDGDKVYYAPDAEDGTPMIVWRGKGVVYYLVAEGDGQLASAAGEMGMKVGI